MMSTTQDQVAADIRYTAEKLPAHLGSDPSEEALKGWFSNYGWVWLRQISNSSGNTVKFDNPYGDSNGDIAPGETALTYTQGYIPYWSYSKRYEVTYYNKAFNEWKKISIKDLDGNWWVSFDHDGDDEDIRTISPATFASIPATIAAFDLTITDYGYVLYNVGRETLIGRISFQPA